MRVMRPSLLACTLLLSLGCARSVEPMGRARDAGPPVEPPGAAAECRSDADCSITLVPEGGCCPRLCLGRAVPATESLKLDERQRACEERGGPCPDPVCARPRHRPVAVCTGGRCATRMMPMEER
jgi:hypothetical protein